MSEKISLDSSDIKTCRLFLTGLTWGVDTMVINMDIILIITIQMRIDYCIP